MRVGGAGGIFNVLLILITLSRWQSQYLILSAHSFSLHGTFALHEAWVQDLSTKKVVCPFKIVWHFFLCPHHQTQAWCPHVAKFFLLLSAREQETRTNPSAKMVASPMNGNYCMSKAILFQLAFLTDFQWHFKVGWLSCSLPELPTPPLWGTLLVSAQRHLSCSQLSSRFHLVM